VSIAPNKVLTSIWLGPVSMLLSQACEVLGGFPKLAKLGSSEISTLQTRAFGARC
jgi:hypothetical protein